MPATMPIAEHFRSSEHNGHELLLVPEFFESVYFLRVVHNLPQPFADGTDMGEWKVQEGREEFLHDSQAHCTKY